MFAPSPNTPSQANPDVVAEGRRQQAGFRAHRTQNGLSLELPQGTLIMKRSRKGGSIISMAFAETVAQQGSARVQRFATQSPRGRFFNPMEMARVAGDVPNIEMAVFTLLALAHNHAGRYGYDQQEYKKYLVNFGTKIMKLNEDEVCELTRVRSPNKESARPALVIPAVGRVDWAPRKK